MPIPQGPCRCARKAAAAVRAGYIDPERLVFTPRRLSSVREQITRSGLAVEDRMIAEGMGVFLEEPFLDCPPAMMRSLFMRLDTSPRRPTIRGA